jgi:hypothetical protein
MLSPSGCGGGGGDTSTLGPPITSHDKGGSYAGACLVCHGPGTGADQFPAEHNGRTNNECLDCHR